MSQPVPTILSAEPPGANGNGSHDPAAPPVMAEPSPESKSMLEAEPIEECNRIRSTIENPYADIDALMEAIDAELAITRKLVDDEERKTFRKLRPT